MDKSTLLLLLVASIQIVSCNLTQEEARTLLEDAGISVAGICHDKSNSLCTSLEGIREATINGLVKLKKDSECENMVVTGGTESGHYSNGTYTHENGYRINILTDPCINKYIAAHANCKHIKGAKDVVACEDEQSNNYILLKMHWDIGFAPKYPMLSYLATLLNTTSAQ